ncbi:hypothetical protein JCM10207_001006 [Rhodosporidiobolus poonsookiae]
MATVGDWWPAQSNFDQCSSGLSISEWCLAPTDSCCGLCPNAPITGPGTIIVFTVGTLFNLLVGLLWRSEAPFNLLFQMLGTDGAYVALLYRYLASDNRLTAFHAAFVPLAMLSAVPISVATSTVEIELLHGLSPANMRAMNEARLKALEAERKSEALEAETALAKHTSRYHFQPEDRAAIQKVNAALFKRKAWLPRSAITLFVVHLILWIVFFPLAIVMYPDPFQATCNDGWNIRSYRIQIGAMAVTLWIIAALTAWALVAGFAAKKRGKPAADVFQVFALAVHWKWLADKLAPPRAQEGKPIPFWTFREKFRWFLSFSTFFLFVAFYLSTYFRGLQNFILLGNNPFDYGQTAACISQIVPMLVVIRARREDANSRAAHVAKAATPARRSPRSSRRPSALRGKLRLTRAKRPGRHSSSDSSDYFGDYTMSGGNGLERPGVEHPAVPLEPSPPSPPKFTIRRKPVAKPAHHAQVTDSSDAVNSTAITHTHKVQHPRHASTDSSDGARHATVPARPLRRRDSMPQMRPLDLRRKPKSPNLHGQFSSSDTA